MSKGYSSEDAAERMQRAREAKQREADEEALAERAMRAAEEQAKRKGG